MDINTLRGLATVFALLAFIGVVLWAYSSSKKKDFDEAANLPFADDPDSLENSDQEKNNG
ncbi:cbb3-type cytochrome c oxidase subunit 3 [Aestuariirhabdus sp. Z084]|uniref:cbb3-type cytochrome oxidase subunit 3 n=1 Tax=Aestuariirhabdus haliotis TaxID=2918751 RepID=UPI00201B3BC2|nr:cbb3-type cytochrome c oxidase subunit 3 [Aestuariirhabdus haliotis]MCL6415770.1 cbb3-type cytochrome c oxidase subunit 3 [Aestuariirhabdus haliotis]MCL6419687.1 cbb3-type cytochrome c oxidase subunit 3 [Aestuariirhabdus haliotis]